MSLNCDIVMDLSAMYYDGSASEASVEAVEAHLTKCSECRRFYREYRAMLKRAHAKKPAEDSPDSDFAKIACKLKKRHMLVIGGVVLYACALAGAAAFFMLRSGAKKGAVCRAADD